MKESKIRWSIENNKNIDVNKYLPTAKSCCSFNDEKIIFTVALFYKICHLNNENNTIFSTSININDILRFKLKLIQKYINKHFCVKIKIKEQYYNIRNSKIEYHLENGEIVDFGETPKITLKDSYYDIFYDMVDIIYKEPIYEIASLVSYINPYDDAEKRIEEKLSKDVFRRLKIENILG